MQPGTFVNRFVFVLLLPVAMLSASLDASEVQTVALSGGQPAGVASGAAYQSFYRPVLNNAGEVAFWADMKTGLAGVKYADSPGVWAGAAGQLRLVARTGSHAPGTPAGTNFSGMGSVLINDVGSVAFQGWLGTRSPPRRVADGTDITQSALLDGTNDTGIWLEKQGALRLALREGDVGTFGDSTFTFQRFGATLSSASYDTGPHLALSDSGLVAFFAEFGPNEPAGLRRYGIAVGDGDSVTISAITDVEIPQANGGVFSYLATLGPVVNQSGEVAFASTIKYPSGVAESGTWVWGNGSLDLVARAGDPVPNPNTGNEVILRPVRPPVINRAGDVAFLARSEDNRTAICAARNGILQVIALVGETGDEAASVAAFQTLKTPVLNDAGAVAFRASSLQEPEAATALDDSGIWLSTGDGLRLVAREGQQAPGAPDGAVFGDFIISGPYGNGFLELNNWVDPVLNGRGQVAFFARLREGGGDGLWAEDADGVLQLVARTGGVLELSPGDLRVIRELGSPPGNASDRYGIGQTGNGDGRPSIFNDRGQIVFSATFIDGSSGVFISNVAAVPEPTGMAGVLLCCWVCWSRRPSSDRRCLRQKKRCQAPFS